MSKSAYMVKPFLRGNPHEMRPKSLSLISMWDDLNVNMIGFVGNIFLYFSTVSGRGIPYLICQRRKI